MPRSQRSSRREIIILVLIVASVALASFDRRGSAADKVRSQAAHVLAPSQSWLKNMTLTIVGGRTDSPRPDASYEARISDLQHRLAEAERREVSLQMKLTEEQARRREIRQLVQEFDRQDYPLRLLPADVVSRQYLLPHGDLRINVGTQGGVARGHWVVNRYLSRGAAAGVREGQPVLAGTGLVGLIGETAEGFSQVRLVTSEQCILPARVIHWDAERGQWVPQDKAGHLRGSGDGQTMHLDQMTRDQVTVAPGDYVVTAGAETGLPEYAIIGQVVEASYLPDSDNTYRILVTPRVNLDTLDRVYVLAPRDGK